MRNWVPVIALACVACTSPRLLAVDLRTDYEPGRDFVGVRTELFREHDPRASAAAPDAQEEIAATRMRDFYAGQRVAEIGGLTEGAHFIRVSLIGASGDAIASRLVSLSLEGSHVATVVITRTCASVTCPRSGDAPGATECSGARCVDPSCTAPGSSECPAECESDAECVLAHADCAAPRCESGFCLLAADDARCESGFACHAIDGCYEVGGEPPDGGASFDAGPIECMGECAPGAVDTGSESCGSCATQPVSRTCGADCRWGAWSATGPCSGAGECTPGQTESGGEGCGNCGSRSIGRTCGADCRWGGWSATSACSGEGPCSPGATDSAPQACGCTGTQTCTRTCDGSCNWGAFACGACSGDAFCVDESSGSPVCPGGTGLQGCPTAPGCYRLCTCSSGGGWTSCGSMCLC